MLRKLLEDCRAYLERERGLAAWHGGLIPARRQALPVHTIPKHESPLIRARTNRAPWIAVGVDVDMPDKMLFSSTVSVLGRVATVCGGTTLSKVAMTEAGIGTMIHSVWPHAFSVGRCADAAAQLEDDLVSEPRFGDVSRILARTAQRYKLLAHALANSPTFLGNGRARDPRLRIILDLAAKNARFDRAEMARALSLSPSPATITGAGPGVDAQLRSYGWRSCNWLCRQQLPAKREL